MAMAPPAATVLLPLNVTLLHVRLVPAAPPWIAPPLLAADRLPPDNFICSSVIEVLAVMV